MFNYPLFKVNLNQVEALKNLTSVFASGFINEGEQVIELEKRLSEFLEVSNLTLMNSCTSALTTALRIIGVGKGDEVISTAMTCVATNTPIINMGARLVWADIDPDTGMISAEDVEKLITPKTKAIMIVDWAGTPADLRSFQRISEKYSLPVIQDAAHAFGARYEGRPISDFTDFTCYSFQAIKHFTTGDGGALICRRTEDHLLSKKLKWFGYDRDAVKDAKGEWKGQKWDADIFAEEVGYKFNLNNMAAAVGLANLPNMKSVLEKHRGNAELLHFLLSKHSRVHLMRSPEDALSSFWVFTLRLKVTEKQRDSVMANLNSKGIGAGLVHLPNNRYSAFQEFHRDLPNTELFSSTQISLPCGWWLESEDIQAIADALLNELDAQDA
jgi:dTDP-4-amino-4,6-dideoxygalactose transaminase